jgi:uncharacterized membrane protein
VTRSSSGTELETIESPSSATRAKFWLWGKYLGSGIAPTGLWLGVALATSLALGAVHSPLVPLPGVVTILFVPGAAVMSMLRTRPANVEGRVVLSVCLSMLVIMVVGGTASLLGPHIGIAHPLGAATQIVIWGIAAVGVLAVGATNHRDPVTWIFDGCHNPHLIGILTSTLLVVVSILGVAELNHTGDIHLAVFGTVLDVGVVLAGIVGGWRRDSRWPLSTLLYGASLALLLSVSLRGGHLYGSDVQKEFSVAFSTTHAGVWRIPANHDAYSSMLSLTVLPAILSSFLKLHLLAFFELIVPAILALLPVAIFSSVRSVPRWVNIGRAVPRPGLALAVVSAIIVSSVAFSSALVEITRQAMATTMLAAIILVLLDRTMSKRSSQIVIGLLIVAISFTHYTTSYLLAAILLCAWCVTLLWERGWVLIPKENIERHREIVRSRRILNGALVILASAAAFGWNLVITRNDALSSPVQAVAQKGVGIGSTTLSGVLPPLQLERLLISELRKTARYIVPVPGSRLVRLVSAAPPTSKGIIPGFWSNIGVIATEGTWIILGVALLYGIFRLGRRLLFAYSPDLVGLGVTGLLLGGLLRYSGTLAVFYNPERAAIITAILLAAPVTMFLDDLVSRLASATPKVTWPSRIALPVIVTYVAVLSVVATGLSTFIVGGQAPGSLSANDENVENFSVSTPEFATATWLKNNVTYPNFVQADLHGQLVLLSQPGSYGLVDEIVPAEVDKGAFIYLSQVNLADNISQAAADGGDFTTAYHSTVGFFNRNFYVVYSTGATRVYH